MTPDGHPETAEEFLQQQMRKAGIRIATEEEHLAAFRSGVVGYIELPIVIIGSGD